MPKFKQSIKKIAGSVEKPAWTTVKIERSLIDAINDDGSVHYRIVFPFGPNNISYAEYNGTYEKIERPLIKPLHVFAKPSLRTVTFDAIIVHRPSGGLVSGPLNDDGDHVQDVLDKLETISQSGMTCKFIYGISELPYKCFLTKFSYTVERRAASGEILAATASIQLTEKISYNPNVSQLPLVVRPPVNITVQSKGNNNTATDYDEIVTSAIGYGQVNSEAKNQTLTWAENNGITNPQQISIYYDMTIGWLT